MQFIVGFFRKKEEVFQQPFRFCKGCGKALPLLVLKCPECGREDKYCSFCNQLIAVEEVRCPYCQHLVDRY